MFKIGPRLWKTGLAVAITVFLVRLTLNNYEVEVFGALAALLVVAPSAGKSLKAGLQTILANVLGGVIGIAAVMATGPNPITMGVVVVLVLLLCQVMKWRGLANAAVTVTLFVMTPHTEAVYTYAASRLGAVVIGSLVGTAVNTLIFRPEHRQAALKAINDAGEALDQFILSVVERLERPESYPKQEILAGAAKVEEAIGEARQCTALMGEQGFGSRFRQDKEMLERSIRVLASLLERIQIIHKASLGAQHAPAYPTAVKEIQEAVRQAVAYRKKLFVYLGGPELAEESMLEALQAMERRFESAIALPQQPEEAEAYFRLYRMRSSTSYMFNRLARLHVKTNKAKLEDIAATVAGAAD